MSIQVNDVVETDGGRYVCVGVDPRGPTFAPEKAGGGPDLKSGTRRLMGPRVVALWKPLTRMTVPVDMSVNPPDNWHEMRKHHPGMLLLYRVGDNYELFADDAKAGADVLGSHVVPAKDVERALTALLRAGHRVAICEDRKPISERRAE